MNWKPVKYFEDLYHISDCGKLKRIKGGRRTFAGKILRPYKNKRGYLTASLSRDDINTQTFIHTLVAQAFIGDRPKGMGINHKDANKTNNHITNLEYCTLEQNLDHARKLGLLSLCKKEKTICSITNCSSYQIALGLCNKHYIQKRKGKL